MATKLTEITTQYNTFIDDQVLTKDQLNRFLDYFEDQGRLSRVFLSGVGIVCGFNLTFDASKKSVVITQGTGITTDGDLVNLRQAIPESNLKSIDLTHLEFSWAKKFEDKFANYRFFKRFGPSWKKLHEMPLEMWEILPEKEEKASELSKVDDLKNKVVLLYLECYPKQGDHCSTIDCDNQGIEQVARLRVLLVSKTDAEFILNLDPVFSIHNIAGSYFDLPEVAVRRVVLNQKNTAGYNELKKAYHQAINSDNLVPELAKGIEKIVHDFGALLQLDTTNINLNSYTTKLKNIFDFGSYNVPFDIQYRYDFIKDLVDTYNEIKSLLFSLNGVCFPDINAFPKHLMLGSLDEIGKSVQNYRHGFYHSPIAKEGFDNINKCRGLVLRMLSLILGFQIKNGDIKITPSNKLPDLGDRSIPFYYKIKTELLNNWNSVKSENHNQNTLLSYHTELLSSVPQVQEPLAFNTDRFDFYRIEGHQGKDYKEAMADIEALKVKYGLPFEVKALSIDVNTETLNIDDYECEFEDLKILLKAWTAEQNCILGQVSQLISGYSLTKPGTNHAEAAGVKVKRLARKKPEEIVRHAKEIRSMVENAKNLYRTGIVNQPRYVKNNVVTENLTLNEDALGTALKIALEEEKYGSVNDIVASTKHLVEEKINAEVWAGQDEMKNVLINNSIELIANAHVVSRKMPVELTFVTNAVINDYKSVLKSFCRLLEQLKKKYQTIDLSAALKALVSIQITQLSSICCSAKKLELLLEEINSRKEKILARLQLLKYVELHPGLEHKAGVEPGGTFFLIYLNKSKTTDEAKKVIPKIDIEQLLLESYYRNKIDYAYLSERDKFEIEKKLPGILGEAVWDKEEDLATLLEPIRPIRPIRPTRPIRPIRPVRPTIPTNIPANTVVADFSLPWVCCSDCAPVNFIVERKPVKLRLETDHFCLGQDKSPLQFEVSPTDGVIKADQKIEGMAIEGNKLIFDEKTFPDKMLGETIHFTVNDQITNCEITVYRSIEFDFKVPDSPTSETKITFIPEGDLKGASFHWDFGDEKQSTERNPTHVYTLPVNEENKVTVSLTVIAPNGVCQTTVKHEIVFKEVDVQIRLSKNNFCENETDPYTFEVIPENAVVKIEGKGVSQMTNGNFVFVPSKAGPGNFEFTLNGNPSGVKVTVREVPYASFTPKQKGNQLILTNNSTGANSFVWFINGEKLERTNTTPVVIDLTPTTPTKWELALEAYSETCGSDKTKLITFETEITDNCIEDTRNIIQNNLNFLQTLNIQDSDFVPPIWTLTSEIYGGTSDFKDGVLNDLEGYLSGKNNDKLPEMFLNLLQQTTDFIIELSGNPNGKEYKNLVALLSLQISLFYNVLCCQNTDTLQDYKDLIFNLLELITGILRHLKERKIKLPETLKMFFENWSEKVKGQEFFEEHINIIKDEMLI